MKDRILIPFFFATIVTFSVFYLMQLMVSFKGHLKLDERELKSLALEKVIDELEPKKIRDLPVRPAIDPVPENKINISSSGDSGLIPIQVFDAFPTVETELKITSQVDGVALPILKVSPIYPRRALRNGIEGYVVVEFSISETGAVINPVVIDTDKPGYFENAALNAALKFKYKPQVINGIPIQVSGVRNVFNFTLND